MIRREELREYADNLGFNVGQTEKNYLHIITLHAIARLFPDSLVFKGGTALMICHNLDRFSEDLDFTLIKPEREQLARLQKFLKQQGIELDTKQTNETKISTSFLLRYQGPLYTGTQQTTAKVELDISLRENVEQQTENVRIIHPYKDTPTFYMQTMTLQEILAEKIRAILTRQKARDMYDAEYILSKGIVPDNCLINKKLTYYGTSLEAQDLDRALENKKGIWKPELSNLVKHVPDFLMIKQKILKAVQIRG